MAQTPSDWLDRYGGEDVADASVPIEQMVPERPPESGPFPAAARAAPPGKPRRIEHHAFKGILIFSPVRSVSLSLPN